MTLKDGLAFALVLLVGCWNDVPSDVRSLDELDGNAVLVRVGRFSLTKSDYESEVGFRLACCRSPVGSNAATNRMSVCAEIVPHFIRNAMMQNAADAFETSEGPIDRQRILAAQREMIRLYDEPSERGPTVSFLDVTNAVAAAGCYEAFMRCFSDECRIEAFIMSSMTNHMIVDAIAVTNFHWTLNRYNQVANRTNEVIVATAKMVLEQARNGCDFAELANRYSMAENKSAGGDLGECMASDFADTPGLFQRLKDLGEGQVSDLMDVGDGYCIYKRLKRNPAEYTSELPDSLHLAQIFFRRAETMPPFTDEEVRHELLRIRREKISEILLKRAFLKYNVEFPCGWRMFPGDQLRKFMATVEEIIHPGGDNQYLLEHERKMLRNRGIQKLKK